MFPDNIKLFIAVTDLCAIGKQDSISRIIAAIITPTSDVFTLCLVALPICLLYEVSIWVVRR